jgi:NACHT domain
LRCPDSLTIKTRLKENKDKLLHKSFDWILCDLQYIRWQDSDDICLLWIKGGAGKGKTMMSIGLIEELSQRSRDTTVVTYFFCQNADYELNTVEAIIKGLILQMVKQQESVKPSLRDRWDIKHERFHEDVNTWRGLWNVFIEMLERCQCPRVYVVVDALDECRDNGIADLLKLIVRTGLSRPSRVKWLLTSRPLDSAERELLAGSDQVRVSLELNAQHISQGVRTYISYKVAELDRRWGHRLVLQQDIEKELGRRAEDTFLWVSLVCKRLENVRWDQALATIQDLPPDLNDLYHRMLVQLCDGETSLVEGCVQLLQVMMLAYRPLNVHEVSSVTGLPDDPRYIEGLVDRSASFVKRRGIYVEFVHQSTRDYLAGRHGRSLLSFYDQNSHSEIAVRCLVHMSQRLQVNLLDLPRLDIMRDTTNKYKNELLTSLAYAATFWFKHVDMAKDHPVVQDALAEDGKLGMFLRTRFLEWLECLSLLDQLPQAVEALKILSDILTVTMDVSLFSTISISVYNLNTYLILATLFPVSIGAGRYPFPITTLSDTVDLATADLQFCDYFQPRTKLSEKEKFRQSPLLAHQDSY